MSEAKRKLFGLFRSRSTSNKTAKDSKNDRDRRGRRPLQSSGNSSRPNRERPHSAHLTSANTESRKSAGSFASSAPLTLPQWPPEGFSRDGDLSQGKAMESIASGVPVFKGHRHSIPHTSDEYYRLYATCEGSGRVGTDRGDPYNDAFQASSFRIQDPEPALHPWETLEHPSLAFCYGSMAGTNTLNHWVSLSGNQNPSIELRDPGVKPRDVELSTIIERLVYLEGGFEENYEDLMYKNLYKSFLRDPDKHTNPHKAMEKQIADLIIVLSRPEWIDFSRPENQVVAKFFANNTYNDFRRFKTFFHQLLLSTELDFRIHSKHHSDWAKEKLLSQLPPCIAWDLAVSRKWQECMRIELSNTDDNPEGIRLHLRSKKAQVKALRKFAKVLKWPNLARIDDVLQERSSGATPLEDRSSDAMSYFSGMILPGVTLPWLIMNSLIDCDDDSGINALAALTHMHPHSGFQYKGTTYWSATSIVGKVLGPTCKEIGGWIGPGRPTPDLSRVQIARIRQRRPKQVLTIGDVESMTVRSDPLGPPSAVYPVSEYQVLLPDLDDIVDTIRIEKLALKPIVSLTAPEIKDKDKVKPLTYDAAVQFAIDGRSWPLRLSYDVSFIASYPCSRGPHPLFFDYVYKAVKVDEILTIKDWGGINGTASSVGGRSSSTGGDRATSPILTAQSLEEDDNEAERVLVIEAFGVPDNEVLARAWCSNWQLSAIVADVEKTCMACAIREAYAACLNVVILVAEGFNQESDA